MPTRSGFPRPPAAGWQKNSAWQDAIRSTSRRMPAHVIREYGWPAIRPRFGWPDDNMMAWESREPLAVRNPISGSAGEEPPKTAPAFAFCRLFTAGVVSGPPPDEISSDSGLVPADAGCMLVVAADGNGSAFRREHPPCRW